MHDADLMILAESDSTYPRGTGETSLILKISQKRENP